MNNQPKSSSAAPVIIILVVFAAIMFGGWWLYSSSQPDRSGTFGANNSTTNPTPVQPVKLEPGAQPPNMRGSTTAKVVVEEFADFQCPSCATTHPIMKEVQSNYGDRIQFIFRHFPLTGHDKSYDAAVATEAARLQGKFWEMQDRIFSTQTAWANDPDFRNVFAKYAEELGMNVDQYKSDVAGTATKSRVDLDRTRGYSMAVRSTPSVYVNGNLVPYRSMTVDAMKMIIDAELQKAASATPAPTASTASGVTPSAASNSNTTK